MTNRSARINKIIAILRDQGNASFEYLASVLETSQITVVGTLPPLQRERNTLLFSMYRAA